MSWFSCIVYDTGPISLIQAQFHTFTSVSPIFAPLLLKRLFFPCCVFLALLSKISWLCTHRFSSGFSTQLHWLYVSFYTSIILFWLLQLCDIAQTQEVCCLQLCTSCKNCFSYLGYFFCVHISFRIVFLFLWKVTLEFW